MDIGRSIQFTNSVSSSNTRQRVVAIKLSMLGFWVVMPCRFVGGYLRLGETYTSIFSPEVQLCYNVED
jgi:hypothetical protein